LQQIQTYHRYAVKLRIYFFPAFNNAGYKYFAPMGQTIGVMFVTNTASYKHFAPMGQSRVSGVMFVASNPNNQPHSGEMFVARFVAMSTTPNITI
jgi:hypothetical protein